MAITVTILSGSLHLSPLMVVCWLHLQLNVCSNQRQLSFGYSSVCICICIVFVIVFVWIGISDFRLHLRLNVTSTWWLLGFGYLECFELSKWVTNVTSGVVGSGNASCSSALTTKCVWWTYWWCQSYCPQKRLGATELVGISEYMCSTGGGSNIIAISWKRGIVLLNWLA